MLIIQAITEVREQLTYDEVTTLFFWHNELNRTTPMKSVSITASIMWKTCYPSVANQEAHNTNLIRQKDYKEWHDGGYC